MKKTMIISSMAIVMSLISSTTFGKVVHKQPVVHTPAPTVVVVKHDDCHHHGVKPHHHVFNRHNECKVCHLTKHQIQKMEREMHKHHHGKPDASWRNTCQQPARR